MPAVEQLKVCTKCGFAKKLKSFGLRKGKARKPGDRHAECKDCTNIHRRARYSGDEGFRKRSIELVTNSYVKLKQDVFAAYGDKCACCGETEPTFLTVDHMNSDGAEHRRKIGEGSRVLYYFLKRNDYPSGFQLLCYNCNCSKGHHGMCVHQLHKP